MSAPKECPVCGKDSIHPVTRTVLVKLDDRELPDVIAYRCGQGHLFLLAPSEQDEPKTG
jgi:hypothetical protein